MAPWRPISYYFPSPRAKPLRSFVPPNQSSGSEYVVLQLVCHRNGELAKLRRRRLVNFLFCSRLSSERQERSPPSCTGALLSPPGLSVTITNSAEFIRRSSNQNGDRSNEPGSNQTNMNSHRRRIAELLHIRSAVPCHGGRPRPTEAWQREGEDGAGRSGGVAKCVKLDQRPPLTLLVVVISSIYCATN